ncbi:MAG: glycerol-3-phosphate dehydrogenase/oxidase [Desulforhopalus sp.]
MQRNFNPLSEKVFDLAIIGGGVYGIACARDAALRGLSVVLFESKDFGGQTSANSAKIAHCGMRYLQHLDFKRMRESIRERNNLHQLAPHLVESQPFLMPIYGHGIKGKETLTLYLKLYDLLSPERRQFSDPYRKVPGSKIISRKEVLEIAPGIVEEGLNGGAVWYEGQMQNTERLTMSMLRSAKEFDAEFFNYSKVTKIINKGNRVTGLEVKDLLGDNSFNVQARYVLNTAGPWINKIFEISDLNFRDHGIYASKAFSLLTKPISDKFAITFPIRPMYTDNKAVVDKKSSLQFAIPWRGKTMYASLHLPCDENPDNVRITEEEINTYIERINEGFPGAKLKRSDIDHVLWGIVPAESKGSAAPMKHYKLIDHQKEEGIEGMGTLVGVKYVTARDVAKKAIDMVEKNLNQPCTSCQTDKKPLWGGNIDFFEESLKSIITQHRKILSEDQIMNLIRTYGTKCEDVIAMSLESEELRQVIPKTDIIRAQIVYAAREELAEKLSDIILRRTDLGSHGYPGDEALQICAEIMAKEKKWSKERIEEEIQTAKDEYIYSHK